MNTKPLLDFKHPFDLIHVSPWGELRSSTALAACWGWSSRRRPAVGKDPGHHTRGVGATATFFVISFVMVWIEHMSKHSHQYQYLFDAHWQFHLWYHVHSPLGPWAQRALGVQSSVLHWVGYLGDVSPSLGNCGPPNDRSDVIEKASPCRRPNKFYKFSGRYCINL